MIERTTVRLPRELISRAKRKALAERRTLTSLMEEGLRLIVDDTRKPPKPKRVLPRYSDAVGGPMPGIDISDSSALQQIEDLEYAERIKHFK